MTNEELFEYLMTSDLHEEWSPTELREMIKFFRKEVRMIHGSKKSMEYEIDKLKKESEFKDRLVTKKEIERKGFETSYNKILNRKLGFKERLFGKINTRK